MKKIVAVAAMLALCAVGFGCVANTMDVEIDKQTRAITLTAPTTTNAVVNMEVEVKEGQSLAYAVNVEQGQWRVKFGHMNGDESITDYENNPIESDVVDTVALEPGTYQMVVLSMDGVGRYKVQAYDTSDTAALAALKTELQTAVETMPASQ